MRNVALAVVAVLAVAAGIYAYTLPGRVQLVECHQNFQLCTQACDADLQRALAALAPELLRIELQLMQDISLCGPPITDEARQCIADAHARANREEARVKSQARDAQLQCIAGCKTRNNRCLHDNPVRQLTGTVDINCLVSGGRGCVTDLPKVCTQMEGACGDCGISLCGGGEWLFDSELPLTVTLVAAADLLNPRVLVTSTPRGNQAVLNVPADLKLNGEEKLYLAFASPKKPRGTVKVKVHRDK